MKKLILLLFLIPTLATAQNNIHNATTVERVDTLMQKGLDHFDVVGVSVLLLNENSPLAEPNLDERGMLGYVHTVNRTNFIVVLNLGLIKERLSLVVAHELIHIEQHYSKRLVVVNDSLTFFNNQPYNTKNVPTHLYPWEIEAYVFDTQISNIITQ